MIKKKIHASTVCNFTVRSAIQPEILMAISAKYLKKGGMPVILRRGPQFHCYFMENQTLHEMASTL